MVAVIFQFLYVLMVSVENIMGATCGSSGIPFRLEVLPNGQLVLGCASPSCFGGELGGRSVMHDNEDGEDGFFREGDLKKPKRRHRNAPAELAECPQIFTLESCPASDSWVGGIKIEESGKLKVQCCTYEGLKFATEMGKPVVHAGEVFSGGEVIRDGRQTGFDLISNIKPSYELTVSRLSCIPDPPETTNYVYQQPPVIQPSPVYYPVAYQYRRCFTGDTEIVTSVGLKTMKDLQIGDFVLTKEDNSVSKNCNT
ncbi:unnamed protein product [Thelazia callipaeda]|uniref:Uncharacterized protein n=1 Tax=Thelazia callipaeda TaxID=103827 RepID=A0A0N5CXC5_THECL|nr:unnamed protein product [Thelazia callipaeda]